MIWYTATYKDLRGMHNDMKAGSRETKLIALQGHTAKSHVVA